MAAKKNNDREIKTRDNAGGVRKDNRQRQIPEQDDLERLRELLDIKVGGLYVDLILVGVVNLPPSVDTYPERARIRKVAGVALRNIVEPLDFDVTPEVWEAREGLRDVIWQYLEENNMLRVQHLKMPSSAEGLLSSVTQR